MDRSQELGQTPVGKLLLKYFMPAIIGVMANALYNIVDRIYIGRGVGALALSGLSVTFPIMIIAMAFGMLVGMGAASLVSIRLGQQNKPEAEKILGNAFTLLIVISFGITVLGLIFRDTILSMFGAGPATLGYAKQYITIILWGNVFQGIGFGMNNMIRAEGHAKVAMYTMLIGAVANSLLDPLFIFVFQMGVAGAAVATVISMAITSTWVLLHFTGSKSGLRLKSANLRLERGIVLGIFSIGMAPFAMQLAGSVINALVQHPADKIRRGPGGGGHGDHQQRGHDGGLLRDRHQHGLPAHHRLQLRSQAVCQGQKDPQAGPDRRPPASPPPGGWRCRYSPRPSSRCSTPAIPDCWP